MTVIHKWIIPFCKIFLVEKIWYFKLWLLDLTEVIVLNIEGLTNQLRLISLFLNRWLWLISAQPLIIFLSFFRDFLRAGSDVMQAFTFYATEDKLVNRGNKAGETIGVDKINRFIFHYSIVQFFFFSIHHFLFLLSLSLRS